MPGLVTAIDTEHITDIHTAVSRIRVSTLQPDQPHVQYRTGNNQETRGLRETLRETCSNQNADQSDESQ